MDHYEHLIFNMDMVVANFVSDDASVFLSNGDGAFTPEANYGTGLDPYSVALGDVNGDSKLDMVLVNQSTNRVSILINIFTP